MAVADLWCALSCLRSLQRGRGSCGPDSLFRRTRGTGGRADNWKRRSWPHFISVVVGGSAECAGLRRAAGDTARGALPDG